MASGTTTTMLRPSDHAYLDEHFTWDAVVEGGMVAVTVKDYPLAVGLTPAVNELLFRLPAGFPDVGPDMFWFATPVTRLDGAPIAATELRETHLGRSWQRWSRHIGGRWRPGVDSVRSYMAYIAACVREAAK